MSKILQMRVKLRHKYETRKKKHTKCNIITQAYRSRCSSETHQVIKTFGTLQQGEVSSLNDDFRFLFVKRRISQPQPNKRASQE